MKIYNNCVWRNLTFQCLRPSLDAVVYALKTLTPGKCGCSHAHRLVVYGVYKLVIHHVRLIFLKARIVK